MLPPCYLHRMLAIWAQAFDGRDRFAVRHVECRQAGSDRIFAEVDRAGPADAGPAPKFGAGQSNLVSQIPKQRQVWIAAERVLLSVHGYYRHD
jgi:hypothetical protein